MNYQNLFSGIQPQAWFEVFSCLVSETTAVFAESWEQNPGVFSGAMRGVCDCCPQ